MIDEGLKKTLNDKNTYFVLRDRKKVLFALINPKKRTAITMDLRFKKDEYAKDVEDYFKRDWKK